MTTNWPELTKELSSDRKTLRGGAPAVMKAFSAIAQAAMEPKALDAKTKELLAPGISVAVRCDDCVAFHIKGALAQAATRRSRRRAWRIYMGAGPSVMYARRALDVFYQFAAGKDGAP